MPCRSRHHRPRTTAPGRRWSTNVPTPPSDRPGRRGRVARRPRLDPAAECAKVSLCRKAKAMRAGRGGGILGGRLAAAGADVTFLVRDRRAARVAADGLVIKSPTGDLTLPSPKTLTAGAAADAPFDIVLLTCKAYDLGAAIESIAPHVGGA